MNLLLTQFHDSPNLNAVQNAFLEQISELEAVFEQLRNLIDLAAGEQLNLIGRIVGQKRAKMADEDYRLWIQARILLNKCRGTEEDLRAILRVLTKQDVEIREHPEIAFTVFVQQAFKQDPRWIFAMVYEAKPLGVKAHLQVALKDPVFRFDVPQIKPGYFSEWIA